MFEWNISTGTVKRWASSCVHSNYSWRQWVEIVSSIGASRAVGGKAARGATLRSADSNIYILIKTIIHFVPYDKQ